MSFTPLTKEDYDIISVFAERMGPDYCVFAFNYRLGFLADNDRSQTCMFNSLRPGGATLAKQVMWRVNRVCTTGRSHCSLSVY